MAAGDYGATRVLGLDELEKAIEGFIAYGLSSTELLKALEAGGRVVERAAKENIKKHDLIKTRELSNSIGTIPIDGPEPTVIVGTDKIYAAVHEFGATITPKRAKYLQWEDEQGNWHRAKQVTIPARPYLRPAFDLNKDLILEEIQIALRAQVFGL